MSTIELRSIRYHKLETNNSSFTELCPIYANGKILAIVLLVRMGQHDCDESKPTSELGAGRISCHSLIVCCGDCLERPNLCITLPGLSPRHNGAVLALVIEDTADNPDS